ncbi:MAG: hypothetical protein MUE85_11975 [Microscillaceae bacterium]|jgi:hypothetical protein|nr:hypothetical protein [Microscillaceae bacterium]
MKEFWQNIPTEVGQLIIIALFALWIGLEQRQVHTGKDSKLFGTDRTFAFIGIWGYMLWLLDRENLRASWGGGAILAVYYYRKMTDRQDFGLASMLVALITYSLAALVATQPLWLVVLV